MVKLTGFTAPLRDRHVVEIIVQMVVRRVAEELDAPLIPLGACGQPGVAITLEALADGILCLGKRNGRGVAGFVGW